MKAVFRSLGTPSAFFFYGLQPCYSYSLMESQFFFFVGENSYTLKHEIQRWKQSFAAKHGPENLQVLLGATQTVSSIMDAVATMPFIAERRLVLCEGVPKIDKDGLSRVLEVLHPQVIFVVYETKVDKRLGIVKDLLEKAEVKQFDSLPPPKLSAWIREYAASRGAIIGPDAIRALQSIAGDDQWMLQGELDKLAVHAGVASAADTVRNPEITIDHIDVLCVPSGSQVVWQLTDLIGGRKSVQALQFFRRRLERGEEPYGMWVILLNMIKNISALRICLDAGICDERSIAKSSGVNFFSVRGLLPLARSFDRTRVKTLVDWAASTDIALKTGELKYTAERPEELIVLAERAILACG